MKLRQVIPALALALLAGGTALAEPSPVLTWGTNNYGAPGLIDMPTALSRRDGEFGVNVSHFRNQTRVTLTFQLTKRLSTSFRYARLKHIRRDPGVGPVIPLRLDRSFSLHYRLFDEGQIMPAVAVGINDLVGTGIYGGEYVVATKTVTPRVRATLGMGWGRLGSLHGFGNPLGVLGRRFKTRGAAGGGMGGNFDPGTWFHGDAALFGGVEWMVTDRLRLVAEYSSDDYGREDGSAFRRRSPVSLGFSWQANDTLTVSGSYLYGSEIGVQFNWAINPRRSRHGSGRDSAPPPILRGVDAAARTWDEVTPGSFLSRARRQLAAEGLALEGLETRPGLARVELRNDRYAVSAQAIGRAARVLSRIAPAEVERFEIILSRNGMPVTSTILRRQDLEELEFHTVAPDLLRANTVITDARRHLPPVAGRYPVLHYGIEPYLTPSLFDPHNPLRADVGVALVGRYEPLPGLVFSGRIQQRLAGNLNKGDRPSDSVLPHVRSDSYLYYKGGSTTLPELTAAWYFRPGRNLFGRVTAGYLEMMYGGVSAELLWKPQNSALALGIEVNHVRQRDFDQRFGFRNYRTTTGHASVYYAMGHGYQAQLDVGRYLAGDVGATLTLSREFDNGWKIGAFATRTNVSANDFGEGSFDKGIMLTIPLDWATGRPSQTRVTQTIRPVLRDGGARLHVAGRLYEEVRGLQATKLDATWGRFWK